jgi:hypothetical protein
MQEKDIQTGEPARQGFYWAHREGQEPVIAEFTRKKNKTGAVCAWLQHVSDDPTAVKKPVALQGDVIGYRKATKEEVLNALKREPTREENIEAALKRFQDNARVYRGYRHVEIPQVRRLTVDQPVRVGLLEECRVEALADDGQVVVVSYWRRRRERACAPQEPPARVFNAWHWTEVEADTAPTAQPFPREAFPLTFSQMHIESLFHMLVGGNVIDSPDYQRDYVWTEADRERLLDSVFAQRDIGKFAILRRRHPARDEILDGKQRLLTLLAFYASQFPYRGVYWHELAWRDRNVLSSTIVHVAYIEETQSRAFALEMFLEMNTAGVPQSPEHLAHVRALLEAERAKEVAETKNEAAT